MSEDLSKFRRHFPNLSKEILSDAVSVGLSKETRSAATDNDAASSPVVEGFEPSVVHFIRRCDSESQAREIIDYTERRGEISSREAQAMRAQLKEKGLRSFGPKLKPGHYLRHRYL